MEWIITKVNKNIQELEIDSKRRISENKSKEFNITAAK
jgi:hypothetical protein